MQASEQRLWYEQLQRPSWAPPAWLFGPVWAVLYALIAVSFGYVLYKVCRREAPPYLALPLILNLVFNLSFTPLQFGLRSNALAAADVILTLATLIWALVVLWPRFQWAALANIPYLLWVSFATVLQLTITWLNRGR